MSKKFHLKPQVRFPEFCNSGDWDVKELNSLAKRRTERNNGNINRVLTNSAVNGVVDQRDYFDKDIANQNNLDNYFIVDLGDYVYNPRISVTAPVGPISKNKVGKGVMSPLYTVFRFDNDNNDFFDHYFKTSYWHKYLQEISNTGARHDRMSISNDDFMKMPLPYPEQKEQQRIADCLSSLDDLITAEAQKLDAYKAHKKGLMQELFPSVASIRPPSADTQRPEEDDNPVAECLRSKRIEATEEKTVPKLRFPEFRDAGEWEEKTVDQISANVTAGGTPSTTVKNYWGGNIRWMNSGELNHKKVYEVRGRITEEGLRNSSTKFIPERSVLIGLAGQGKTRGTVAMNMVELCINQSIAAIFPNDEKFCSDFLYHNLDNRYEELRSLSAGGEGRGGLNLQIIKSLGIHLPKLKEQQRIADCLSSLDELISAQAQKVEALKMQKKGLLQGLFPSMEGVDA